MLGSRPSHQVKEDHHLHKTRTRLKRIDVLDVQATSCQTHPFIMWDCLLPEVHLEFRDNSGSYNVDQSATLEGYFNSSIN